MIWNKTAGSLPNTTTKVTASTSNIDILLMRGKTSDPFFDLQFSFSKH